MDGAPLLRNAFRLASQCLAGRSSPGMPDWLDRSAVSGVWASLQPADPGLHLTLRPGWSSAAFPRRWQPAGMDVPLTLRWLPGARALGQGLPTLSPERRPTFTGSATALLRDRASARRYLLTCGHVAAPGPEAQASDRVLVSDLSGAEGLAGQLRLWQPMLAAGAFRTPIDAALIEIDAVLFDVLERQAELLPLGVNAATPSLREPLVLRRRSGNSAGTALVHWSGEVDIPGLTPGVADYFLENAIGYRCEVGTQPGDSGAAVWDASGRLRGMHLAGLVDVDPRSEAPNAVYGPIQPVLDWFNVAPVLSGGGTAAVTPATSTVTRDTHPASSAAALTDREVIAATLWGEARNQGPRGLQAVACVIANRARTRYRRCTDARAVCLDRWQFSCWNEKDPNRARMLAVVRQPDDLLLQSLALADDVLAGDIADITRGARHYHTGRIRPFWAKGKQPCAVIGDHLFYNDVA